MVEIDKGSCGECIFFDEHDFVENGSREFWGVCSNFRTSVFYTVSSNSPMQAHIQNNALNAIANFVTTDSTCFRKQEDKQKP